MERMPDKKLIISKGLTKAETIEESLPLFKKLDEILNEDNTVFVKIDLSLPEGYPSVSDPELLEHVINACLSRNVGKVLIGSCSSVGIHSEYCWYSLGLSYLCDDEKVEFIPLEKRIGDGNLEGGVLEQSIRLPEVVEKADCVISIVNPKVDPVFQLNLAADNSSYLFPKTKSQIYVNVDEVDREYCDSNEFIRAQSLLIAKSFMVKKPDLTIIDLNSIIDVAGPSVMADTVFTQTDLMILSDAPILSDIAALHICGLDYGDHHVINALFELEEWTIDDLFKDLDSVSFIGKDNKNNINVIEITEEFIGEIKGKQDEESFKLPQVSLVGTAKLDEIYPEFVNLHLGTIHSGIERALYDFIHLFKTNLIKDKENLDPINIVVGLNPPEPDSKENIVVFGDSAIKTTLNYDFRIVEKRSEVTPEEELEKERIQYQAELREEVLDWEAQMEQTKENIKDQFEDEEKRQKALESLEKEHKQKQEKLDKKYDKFVRKQKKKHEKELEKAEKVKIKKNKDILEIKGNPPILYDYLQLIIDFFGDKNMPMLNLWKSVIDRSYNAENYMEMYKEWLKERKKQIKESIGARKK